MLLFYYENVLKEILCVILVRNYLKWNKQKLIISYAFLFSFVCLFALIEYFLLKLKYLNRTERVYIC